MLGSNAERAFIDAEVSYVEATVGTADEFHRIIHARGEGGNHEAKLVLGKVFGLSGASPEPYLVVSSKTTALHRDLGPDGSSVCSEVTDITVFQPKTI